MSRGGVYAVDGGVKMNLEDKVEHKNNSSLTSLAKTLRRNMTKEEKHLWYDFLCCYPVRIYRQRTIGRYIVDFYCAKAKLVIELDGSQHGDVEAEKYDEERTEYLAQFGIYVLRIPNFKLNNHFNDVCRHIDSVIKSRLE